MRNILPVVDCTLVCHLGERPMTPPVAVGAPRHVISACPGGENDYYRLSAVHFRSAVYLSDCLRGSAKLSGSRISFYYAGLSPRSLRRACPEKYDPRRSFERNIAPLYLDNKSKYPASPLFGVSRILPVFSLASNARFSPCTFVVLNFNE